MKNTEIIDEAIRRLDKGFSAVPIFKFIEAQATQAEREQWLEIEKRKMQNK